MNAHAELLTASQAMELLGIRSKRTLRRIRESKPGVAVVIPGMRHHRYVRRILIQAARLATERSSV